MMMDAKARLILSVLMTSVMVFMVTLIATYLNLGFDPDFLRQWVKEGAEYQEHWAFIAPVRAAAPGSTALSTVLPQPPSAAVSRRTSGRCARTTSREPRGPRERRAERPAPAQPGRSPVRALARPIHDALLPSAPS